MSTRKKHHFFKSWFVGAAFALIGFSGLGMVAQAASETTTQDGIEVTFSTNKDLYTAEESIVATLTVKNTNQYDMPNVTLESYIPYGYQLADGEASTMSVAKLATGQEISLQVTLMSVPEVTADVVTVEAFTTETTATTTQADVTTAEDTTQSSTASSSVSTTVTTTNKAATSKTSGTNTSGPKTGDVFGLAFFLLLLSMIPIAIIMRKKKQSKALLSVALIATVLSNSFNDFRANAEANGDYIALSVPVSVGSNALILDAIVSYEFPTAEEIQPDEYYQENSESIVSVNNAAESERALSEKEVLALLESKGFSGLEVTYRHQLDGSTVTETAASADSNVKHPMYVTYFRSESGEIWTLSIVENAIFASPLEYNVSSSAPEVIFSETETLTSYVQESNYFYVTVPKASAVNLKKIDTITFEALNQITREDFANENE